MCTLLSRLVHQNAYSDSIDPERDLRPLISTHDPGDADVGVLWTTLRRQGLSNSNVFGIGIQPGDKFLLTPSLTDETQIQVQAQVWRTEESQDKRGNSCSGRDGADSIKFCHTTQDDTAILGTGYFWNCPFIISG